jgi:hypothetical protein
MEKHTLMLRYSLIFLFAVLVSCGSRKVNMQKTDTVIKVEGKSEIKKDEVITTQNNISINTNIDEVEITPIDPEKPIIIGDKKYFNAKIKTKKTKSSVVDTTKKDEVKKEIQKVESKEVKEQRAKVKEVDRKESFLPYLWWILILIVIVFFTRKALKKYLL